MRNTPIAFKPMCSALLIAAVALLAQPAAADRDHNRVKARLSGFQEVPSIVSTGSGRFEARLRAESIEYELSYDGLEGNVTQAHIHLGQKGVNAGISVFLCTNIGNGPAGTVACPQSGIVKGTLTSASVVGPGAQNIAPGELAKLSKALRAGATYANVHSSKFPGGEIRGQVKLDDD